MPIREAGIQICEDVPDFREERFTARGVTTIDRVQEDGGSAIVGRRIPGESHLAVSAHRLQILRGRWQGRKEQGGDRRSIRNGLNVVPRSSLNGKAGQQASHERSAHEHEREDPYGPEEAGPVGFPRELGIATPDWVGHGEDTTSPRAYLSRLASNTNEPRGRSRNTASTHAFQRQWGPRP